MHLLTTSLWIERKGPAVIDILSTLSVAPLGLLGLELEKALACQGTNHPCDAFPLFSSLSSSSHQHYYYHTLTPIC